MMMKLNNFVTAVLIISCSLLWAAPATEGNFNSDFDITWGGRSRAKILSNGQLLSLSLDRTSGSGFRSKNRFLYGNIDMQIQLVPGNSAGTVATYYLSSIGANHDEIDLEFLGNLSGQPYTLHTNLYTDGKGGREQQFHLWFDPTKAFHTYSIRWNPQNIIFLVDGTPIRQFKNLKSRGVGYPTSQPMWIYGSLWDAEEWATQGGRVKTDWSRAPFVASFRNFEAHQACVWPSQCSSSSSSSSSAWMKQVLDNNGLQRLRWVRKNYMIYNYCTDTKRGNLPLECSFDVI